MSDIHGVCYDYGLLGYNHCHSLWPVTATFDPYNPIPALGIARAIGSKAASESSAGARPGLGLGVNVNCMYYGSIYA